jgi:hypothetical protein
LIKSPERDFSEAFFTFMQNSKGQCDFPLSYILREHDDPDEVDPGNYATIEAYEEAIVPFSGAHYDVDDCMVFDSLKSYILGGPHWTWIQDFERTRDGRSAWLALKEHFDGPGNKIRLKAAAYAAIKCAEYKGTKNFDYELYRRIHTQAHSDLARYGEPVPETKKVKDFLDGITDSTLQPVKYTIAGFTHLMQNFHEAANYIRNIIYLNKKSEYSSRSISSTSSGRDGGRWARGAGRGRGREREGGRFNNGRGRGRGRGRGGRNPNNPGRWISADEWSNMAEDEKETIRNARANYAKRNISALNTEEDANATDHEPQGSPPKCSNAGTTNAGDHMSRGNRNFISQIRSGRRYITPSERNVSYTRQETTNLREAKAELDSHADTTVAGSTCRILELTEKSCDVFHFSDQYAPMEKVPVAKVGTAYDHPETGETFILVFGQALYLGDKLDHSLICPNQARHNGVVVDDVPKHLSHDGQLTHSLFFPQENMRIPLSLRGVISFLPTRYPTNNEINNCRWLIVTGDDDWEPYNETFEEREKMADHEPVHLQRYVYQVHSSHAHMDLPSHIFHQCSAIASTGRKLITTDESITEIFQCGPKIASKTRLATTQKGIRSMSEHVSRRFRTKQAALRYNQTFLFRYHVLICQVSTWQHHGTDICQ